MIIFGVFYAFISWPSVERSQELTGEMESGNNHSCCSPRMVYGSPMPPGNSTVEQLMQYEDQNNQQPGYSMTHGLVKSQVSKPASHSKPAHGVHPSCLNKKLLPCFFPSVCARDIQLFPLILTPAAGRKSLSDLHYAKQWGGRPTVCFACFTVGGYGRRQQHVWGHTSLLWLITAQEIGHKTFE